MKKRHPAEAEQRPNPQIKGNTHKLTTPRDYRALLALLAGPRTVRELIDIIGTNGVPQLIDRLRNSKGLTIHTVWQPGEDRDGRLTRFCHYVLDHTSLARARELLDSFEPRG